MPAHPSTPSPLLAANALRRKRRRRGLLILALAALSALVYLSTGWYSLTYRSLTKPHTHATLDAGVLDLSLQRPIEPSYFTDSPLDRLAASISSPPRWRLAPSDLPPMPWARRVSIPLWPIPLAIALPGLLLWLANRRELGRCRKCRYDLAGLTPDPATNLLTCPECGTSQRPFQPPLFRQPEAPRPRP